MKYKVNVNGRARTVDAPADMPLLWVLRDVLDVKGPKFGCGAGLCGACTVHLDGIPVRSCSTPVSTVGDRAILTIEGIAENALGRKLQAAWMDLDVPQCGYCQGGQLMSAMALLSHNPRPTDADIDSAMNGNICRCCSYPRIRAAIKQAAGLPTSDTREVV